MLTLLAMYAEEEARSASENQKWRIHKKFENGEPWVGNMLGYRLIDGKMVIVPEEAEIVELIFDWYLSGMGVQTIAKKLNSVNIPARYSDYWHSNVILGILHNEKYAGDMLLQKTFRPDFRTKISRANHGEVRQYYVENSHQAIIDSDTFKAVQSESLRRKEKYAFIHKRNIKTESNLFTGLMVCGLCGSAYCKRTAHAPYKPEPVWICSRYFELGKTACASQQIPENILVEKTKEVLKLTELNRPLINERISRIEVSGHYQLCYLLKDGSVHNVEWKHKSRKDSWTPEMKEKARQRALAHNAERRKNEQRKEDHGH